MTYLPKHFEVTDATRVQALVRAQPLATWVLPQAGELLVNHVPFLLDAEAGEHGTLIGHVARANPVWQALSSGVEAVLVFHGPQAYISPNWYPSKHATGKAVPTWNYAVVHAHGVPRAIDDKARVRDIVTRLTNLHEAGQRLPWQVADAPADYLDAMLGAIVGIEIPVRRWVGKWKISQNRPTPDRQGVAAGLLAGASPDGIAMAALVQPDKDPA